MSKCLPRQKSPVHYDSTIPNCINSTLLNSTNYKKVLGQSKQVVWIQGARQEAFKVKMAAKSITQNKAKRIIVINNIIWITDNIPATKENKTNATKPTGLNYFSDLNSISQREFSMGQKWHWAAIHVYQCSSLSWRQSTKRSCYLLGEAGLYI